MTEQSRYVKKIKAGGQVVQIGDTGQEKLVGAEHGTIFFDPNNGVLKITDQNYPNGWKYVYSGTIWTNSANGCLRAELSETGFQAFTDATHLDLQDSGQWNIGSYQNSTFIGNDEFTNTNILSLRSGDETYITTNLRENGNHQWKFGTDGTLTAPGHLMPNADLAYDLGSTSSQWRSLYVGTSTIYLGGTALSVAGGNITIDGNPIQAGAQTGSTSTLVNGDSLFNISSDGTLTLTHPDEPNFHPLETQLIIQKAAGNYHTISGAYGLSLQATPVPNGYGLNTNTNFVDIFHDGISVNVNDNTWGFGTDGKLTLPEGGAFTSPDYNFSFNGNEGDGVPTLGTVVTSEGGNDIGEIFMGSGYGEFRSIYNSDQIGSTSSGLTYAGVEGFNYAQYGDVNFAGIVSQTPHIDSMYTVGVNTLSQITIGFTQNGQTQESMDWSVAVGSLTTDYTFNGLFADTFKTVISGSQEIKLTTNRGTVLFGNQPECVPTLLTHFHIMKDDPANVDLFFGDDNNYVKLPGDGETAYGVEIGTNVGSAYTWRFGTDGVLTLPSGNTRIGDVYGTDGIVGNTGTGVAVASQGPGGYVGLQWIDNNENIELGTSTQVAAVIVNSPIASTSGTVQIATGLSFGPTAENTWEFGASGILTLPGSSTGDYSGPGVIDYTTSSSLRIGGDQTGVGFRSNNIQHAIAIGNGAQNWNHNTGSYSIVIGSGDDTGYGAKDKSIVIGSGAGFNDGAPVGESSIAIGYRANYLYGHDNSITLNATGEALDIHSSGFFVKPIRESNTNTVNTIFYNTATGELTYTTSTTYQLGGDSTRLTVSNNSVTIQVPGGRPYWAAEFGGITTAVTTSSFTVGTGAFYDSQGNVYVLGGVQFGTNESFGLDSLLLKYDTNGNLLWSRTWHDDGGANCGAVNQAFAIDSNDRIYWLATAAVPGFGCWTGYMDTEGNLGLGGVAQASLGFLDGNFAGADIACDNSGNYYLAGVFFDYVNNTQTPVVIKVDGDNGVPIWTGSIIPEDYEALPAYGQYRAVTVNPVTGDVWAIGDYTDNSNLYAMLSKWDINGTHQWTKKLVTQTGDLSSAVIYNGGYVYTIVNDDGEQEAVVSKFNTDGVLIWASFLAVGALDPIPPIIPGSYNTGAYDLSFDAAGNVYVTGTIPGPPVGQPQLWITKLDPANGEMLYSRILATTEGSSIIDQGVLGSGLVGHRVGDIYQDKIVVTAITQSDINDSTGTNEVRVMVAQLPIDGSVTGTFDNIDIVDLTGDIDSICSTGTYTVTTLVWSTGTSTAITSTSSISVSTVTDVVGLTGETIVLGSGTAGGTTTTNTWTFVNNNIILPPGGDILDSNGVSVLGATTSTTANGWQLTSSTAVVSLSSTGTLTLPGGSTIGETTTTTIISPPGASAGQSFVIRPTGSVVNTETNHIHLVSGNPTTVDLYLGDDDQYVKIEKNAGNVVVGTNSTTTTSTWTFGTDGKLTFPTLPTNQRTGSAEALVFAKSNNQKSIATAKGTVNSPYVERLVIAGGDSYQDPNTGVFAPYSEGGDIYLWAGRGANGGDIKVDAGNAQGVNGEEGGTIKIRGGYSQSGTGGFVHIESGSGTVANGLVRITTAGHNWDFGTDGTLTLPNGGTISDGGAIRLQPAGVSSSTQALVIYPTAQDGNHIHLTADGGSTDLYLGNDSQYVKVDHSGTIVVSTLSANTSTWTFGTNGILTLPAATPVIKGGGTGTDVTIIAANTNTTSTWVFGANGSITFPDSTVQTTAFTGTVAYSNITGAPASVNKTSGSWTLSPGANTVSITVAPGGNYQMWVNGNIPNGIVTWNATVSTSNTNVPVVGSQYGWYYAAGNALVLTSMPNQIVGTAGSISTATTATTTSNVFTFGIRNNSVSTQTVYWGYTTL